MEKIEDLGVQINAHKEVALNEIKNLKEQEQRIKDSIPVLEETVEIQQKINLIKTNPISSAFFSLI